MPTITTAETLCGPRPSPNTNAFLQWCDEYISRRKRQCVFKRTNTYYIDPSAGSDSNNGTTPSTPWASLTPVRTRLSANPTTGNDAFLFKRGTVLRDATGITLTAPNNMFGSYGALDRTDAGGDRPIISHFTVRWLAGSSWTLASGNRYTASVPGTGVNNPSGATSIGYMRMAIDPFNPLTAVESSTVCGTTPFSFFVSGSTVHINLNGDNPNSYDVEAVPLNASPPDGIQILNGSSGIWIDGLRFDGWGCAARGLAWQSGSGNESGIRNMAGGTASEAEHVAYISNCESYYNGTHAFSQEPNGIGGAHLVEGCLAGFGYNVPNNGESTFNSYAGSAGQETVFKDCVTRFGPLPQSVRSSCAVTAGTITTKGKAFYIHSGNSPAQPVSLLLIMGGTILDERSSYSQATVTAESWGWSDVDINAGNQITQTDSAFTGISTTNPAAYRAFVIGWKSPRIRTPGAPTLGYSLTGSMRVVFINSHFYLRRSWDIVSLVDSLTYNWMSVFLNCIFEVDDELEKRCRLFDTQSSAYTAMQRLINCLILVRGRTDAAQESVMAIFGAAGKDKQRLANTAVIGADRSFDATQGKEVSLVRSSEGSRIINDPESLRYVAIAGCRLNDSTFPWIGFNAATGLVNLGTLNTTYPDVASMNGTAMASGRSVNSYYTLDPASPLAGAGSAVPFADKADMLPAPEYDFYGRRRPATPSIGPFDVLNTSTGSGGGGGGGSLAMVRNPVRSTVSG